MKFTELERLKALREYRVLDTENEKVFDDITKLLSEICETEIALISFVDESRQWFKSRVGIDICETPRDIAFCSHAILQDDPFVIEDTHKDDRFKTNPLVTGAPFIRFYAGAVLKTTDGFNIGTLCIAHSSPKKLTSIHLAALKNLASLVMTQIELKNKTTELEMEKAKLRHNLEVLNALPDFAGTCDLDGKILSYNKAFDEVCKKDGVDHIFDYYPEWVRKIQSEIAIPYAIEHNIWRGESAVLKKNGEEFHTFQTVICHRDVFGYPKFFSTVMQDMSEIKAITNRFETLTKLAPVGIYMTDAKGVPTFFNDQWLKTSGMTLEQAMSDKGFGSFAAFHPDDVETVIEKWFNAAQSKVPFSHELRIKNHLTGKIHHIQTNARPLLNSQNEVVGYIGANLDLTDEKELSNKLNSSVKQLGTFIQNIPAAVAMFDHEVRYVAVSKRWIQDYHLDKLGLDEKNILGKTHYEVFPGLSNEWQEIHQNALQGIAKKMDDDNFVRDDGTVEWLNWDVRPWYNEKSQIGGIMMMTEVITDKKFAEIEIRRSQALAEKASEAKSVFLANMSHEMRTPLNSIIGLSDLIAQTPLEEEQSKHISVIQKSGEVLKNLIDDIIDLTKFETGKITLQNVPVNLYELTDKIIQIFQFEAGLKNISLTFNVDKSLPNVEGDPVRISQILIKLLGNALKYTSEGNIDVKVRRDTDGKILISVKDTGIGIAEVKQHIIFEKFTQLESSTIKKYGGTGLGLAITKNLVEMMGGRIWVTSLPGDGSEFSFTLDLKSAKTEPASDKKAATEELGQKNLKILVVDDSLENRNLILAYLKKHPFEVTTAENGLEALELMKKVVYDFVFMDIQMPIMDGLTATRTYRDWETQHRTVHVPIVALTAFALQEDHTKSMNAGCDLHLTKPVKKLTILETIKELTSP
jgi:PAS domain S-box-containing protein